MATYADNSNRFPFRDESPAILSFYYRKTTRTYGMGAYPATADRIYADLISCKTYGTRVSSWFSDLGVHGVLGLTRETSSDRSSRETWKQSG